MVPREVFNAALEGDLAAIETWLGEGGNPMKNTIDPTMTLLSLLSTMTFRTYHRHILAGARLKEYMPLLRLRSLLARGRARHGPETTVVAARLFGSLNGFAGLPGECFWLVVKYAWLGD